jgi:hypothetical protein
VPGTTHLIPYTPCLDHRHVTGRAHAVGFLHLIETTAHREPHSPDKRKPRGQRGGDAARRSSQPIYSIVGAEDRLSKIDQVRNRQPSSGIPCACPMTARSRYAKSTKPAATSTRFQDDLDFIKVQLARLPTRNEVWRAAMLGMLGGAVAAVTLIEAFSRSCL